MLSYVLVSLQLIAAGILAYVFSEQLTDAKKKLSLAAVPPVIVLGMLLMPLHIYSDAAFSETLLEQAVVFVVGFVLCVAAVFAVTRYKNAATRI